MLVKIDRYGSCQPIVSPRLLNDYMAQTAMNCKLVSGDLDTWLAPSTVNTPTKSGTKKSIYLWGDIYWLTWTDDVDVLRGPVAGDTTERTYFTGGSAFVPQMTYSPIAITGGTDYPMASYDTGVPAPTTAPTVTAVDNTGLIAAATKANPCVLSSAGHGRATGDKLVLASLGGMTQLNGQTVTITVIDDDTFSLDGIDSTGYTTYTLGGTWTETYDQSSLETRAYVYTYASALDEEGPPSPASEVITVGYDQEVDLSGLLTGPDSGNYNFAKKRVYRALTGDNGTDYLLVNTDDNLALATTTYADTTLAENLGEAIATTTYDPPPADMFGLVEMPGGIQVGFSGNQVCPCEPYVPYAYPTKYRLTTSHPIIGGACFGNTLVVCTTGGTVLISGTSPDSFTDIKLEDSGLYDGIDSRVLEGCVSKRGIVGMGGTVMYPVGSGIVAVNAGGAQLVTKEFMDEQYWKNLVPSSMSAFTWNGKYIAFYDTGTVQGGFLFDPSNPLDPLSFTDQYATAGFYDKASGNLYLQIGDDIKQWDGGDSPLTRVWRSKIFTAPMPVNFACMQVLAYSYPVTVKVYADGVLKLTKTVTSDGIFWLPSGFLAREWEIQIEGSAKVKSVMMATSVAEIKQAA